MSKVLPVVGVALLLVAPTLLELFLTPSDGDKEPPKKPPPPPPTKKPATPVGKPRPNPVKLGRERAAHILDVVDNHRERWSMPLATLVSVIDGDEVIFTVSADALKVDGVRLGVSTELATHLCERFDMFLPTIRLSDMMWEQGDVKTPPRPQNIMLPIAESEAMHSLAVDRDVAAVAEPGNGIVPNCGKLWIIDSLCWQTNRAVNYGWYLPSGRVIQPAAAAHDVLHYDYSQTFRGISRKCLLNGEETDVASLFGDPLLKRHITGDPKLPGLVHPALQSTS